MSRHKYKLGDIVLIHDSYSKYRSMEVIVVGLHGYTVRDIVSPYAWEIRVLEGQILRKATKLDKALK